MREFELTFLLKPDLDDEKVEEVVGRVREIIAKDGTPSETQTWGKRPLAYPIQHYKEAIYVHIPFSSGTDVPGEITHYFGLNESVLRHLIVHAIPEPPVIEPRIVTKKTEVFIPAKQVKEASEASSPETGDTPAPSAAAASEAEPEAGESTVAEPAKAEEEAVAAPEPESTKAPAAKKPRASRAKAPKGVEEVTGEVEVEEASSPEDTPEG